MFYWLAIVGTTVGMSVGSVFLSLWLHARQRIRIMQLIIDEERARYKRLLHDQPRTSERTSRLEIMNRERDIDEIRERYSGWNDVDDQDDGLL